jgi:hypothetical protein
MTAGFRWFQSVAGHDSIRSVYDNLLKAWNRQSAQNFAGRWTI